MNKLYILTIRIHTLHKIGNNHHENELPVRYSIILYGANANPFERTSCGFFLTSRRHCTWNLFSTCQKYEIESVHHHCYTCRQKKRGTGENYLFK